MNENASSGADEGIGAAGEVAAPLRTAATALLSAADIWSTNSAASGGEANPAPAPTVTMVADQASAKSATETKSTAEPAFAQRLRPSEVLAEARFFSLLQGKRAQQSPAAEAGPDSDCALTPPLASDASINVAIARALERRAAAALAKAGVSAPLPPFPPAWPPQKLSLALQGGGAFGAFTWGALERLLEEPACEFDSLSGASAGAINATLLACGLVTGGREGARRLLARFWQRITDEASFRSLMLIGGFSPAGSSIAFAPSLRSGHFDPFDLDPLREALSRDVDFAALRSPSCPKLLIAATRVRDGRQQIFDNVAISPDVLLASTCPPQAHGAVEIEGQSYWDGGYGANPPLVRLVEESAAPDLLVVQVTPSRDGFVPITLAAIDRRLDQITANAVLNAELAALRWARERGVVAPSLHRIAAEDEIEGLAQRNPADLGRGFITLLHERGRAAADRWLRGTAPAKVAPVAAAEQSATLVDA